MGHKDETCYAKRDIADDVCRRAQYVFTQELLRNCITNLLESHFRWNERAGQPSMSFST